MDMNTFFSLMMFTLTLGALLLAVLNFNYARREIATHRQFIKLYFERAVEEYTEHKKLQATLTQTLAQRITALETYRRHHTERLNAFDEELAQLDMLVNDYLDEQHDVVHAPLCATRQRSGPLFDPVPPPTGACNCGAESGLELESDALARKQGDMITVPETMIDHDSGPGTTIDAMGYFHSAHERQRAARASWDSVHVDVDDYRDTLPGL